MPKFRYNAVSLGGEKMRGDYAAPDKDGVTAMLRQSGFYPLDIRRISEEKTVRQKIHAKTLAAFCHQISAMLRAGVTMTQALHILQSQTENRPMRLILENVYADVQRGGGLYESFGVYRNSFPPFFLNMLEAGEASGALDTCMARAGAAFTRTAKLNGKLRSAMIYPSVLLVLVAGVVALMLGFVIPQFAKLYQDNGARLPALTRALVSVSEGFVRYWYILFLIVFAAVAGVRMWLSSDAGRTAFDGFKLRIPAVSPLLTKVYASRYARGIASLSAAGVPVIRAVEVTARSVSNRFIEKKLYAVADGVRQGEEMSGLLERAAVMPPMIVYMTRLGERAGVTDELLGQAADSYDDESENALQALTALTEPALLVLMAAIVVPVVMAIVLPIFNLYNAMLG